jgi:hypothetical protein
VPAVLQSIVVAYAETTLEEYRDVKIAARRLLRQQEEKNLRLVMRNFAVFGSAVGVLRFLSIFVALSIILEDLVIKDIALLTSSVITSSIFLKSPMHINMNQFGKHFRPKT